MQYLTWRTKLATGAGQENYSENTCILEAGWTRSILFIFFLFQGHHQKSLQTCLNEMGNGFRTP
jgi:hypothetical protein